MPNVQALTQQAYEEGVRVLYEWIRTPVGELTRKRKWDPAYGTSWWEVEYPIKAPGDYRIMEFVIRDQVILPDYEEILLADRRLGEDGYVIGNVRKMPMYQLMYHLVGAEKLPYDLQDHPDEILSLHEAMWEKDKELYKVAVKAPVEMFIGPARNVHPDMVGPKLFQQYYLPCMDHFADLAHEEGKLSGSHLDAKFGFLKGFLEEARFDVVEAFTPAPMGDMTIAEARRAWPEKTLWVNFTSSVHIQSPEEIRQETIRMLHEAAPGDHFLVGITEDVPENAWRTSFSMISRTIREYGALPITTS
jgi:hypothetical protein